MSKFTWILTGDLGRYGKDLTFTSRAKALAWLREHVTINERGQDRIRPAVLEHEYDVYWDVTIDGEATNIKLKGTWKSKLSDPDRVAIEIDEDPDVMGDDFEGYPSDEREHEIVWQGYPIVIPVGN